MTGWSWLGGMLGLVTGGWLGGKKHSVLGAAVGAVGGAWGATKASDYVTGSLQEAKGTADRTLSQGTLGVLGTSPHDAGGGGGDF